MKIIAGILQMTNEWTERENYSIIWAFIYTWRPAYVCWLSVMESVYLLTILITEWFVVGRCYKKERKEFSLPKINVFLQIVYNIPMFKLINIPKGRIQLPNLWSMQ